MYKNATVEIVEQPQPKSMRFRYSSEGRSAGSIFGVKSTEEEKTYPSIRVLNYDGHVRVCVSCVTVDETPKPHPNCLIGKPCRKGLGVFEFTTTAASPKVLKFPQLGIQCPKRDEIKSKLEERMELRIDPFNTGYGHMKKPQLINLQQIRLCFQTFLLPDPHNIVTLRPVVSDIISDKHKTNVKLRIYEKSDDSSPPCGDKKIMIFCDKVDKRDIKIRFYENGADDSVVWQDWAKFQPKDVHKQIAISFRTPKYRDQNITKPVNVFFQLQTISSGTSGEPVPFQYLADVTNIELSLNNKGGKIDSSKELYQILQELQATENGRTSKMTCNIAPNVPDTESISPNGLYSGASNFHTPNIIQLPTQTLQQNNDFLQHAQRENMSQSQNDYQRSSAQAQHGQPQHFNPQQHCQTMSQFSLPSNYQNFSTFDNFDHANATNQNSNNFGNYGRLGQSQGNYQSSPVENLTTPMNCDNATHHSYQPMGPVYTDKVVIQQFCNNSVNISQPQSVADAPMSEILSSELNFF